MEFESNYAIVDTAEFIHSRNFTRVALQFPDELLKDSVQVVHALREKLQSIRHFDTEDNIGGEELSLFVMADTTYGSCCVDEVGASHVDAHCIIHYGHTCFSPTSNLPAFFVFGKAAINASHCAESIIKYAQNNDKPIVVLFGLEYTHAMQKIKGVLRDEKSSLCGSKSPLEINFTDVKCAVMNPSNDLKSSNGHQEAFTCFASNEGYSTGGLLWSLPEGRKIEEYLLFWIGSDNAAFANVQCL